MRACARLHYDPVKGPKAFEPPPSGTPFERFQALAQHVLNVPKAETDKLEAAYTRSRVRKKKRATAD